MTSQQTDALVRLRDAAAAYIMAGSAFGHAFGQDHPEITATVENSAQVVAVAARGVNQIR